jgi:hypothetical protein
MQMGCSAHRRTEFHARARSARPFGRGPASTPAGVGEWRHSGLCAFRRGGGASCGIEKGWGRVLELRRSVGGEAVGAFGLGLAGRRRLRWATGAASAASPRHWSVRMRTTAAGDEMRGLTGDFNKTVETCPSCSIDPNLVQRAQRISSVRRVLAQSVGSGLGEVR